MIKDFITTQLKNSLTLLKKEQELLLNKIREFKKNTKISAEDKEKLERIEEELGMPEEEIMSPKDLSNFYNE